MGYVTTFHIIFRQYPELLLKATGKVRRIIESYNETNLIDPVFSFTQQFSGCFSPFFRLFLISPFTFHTIHDTVIASGALTALKIKQTCRVDVCASSARQTGSCWQDEGNFPRCTYRIPLHQKIAPSIISCCGPRICKGGIFLCKKARTTSFPGSLNHPVNSRRSPLSLPAPCSARCPLYLDTTPLKSHQT